MAIMRKSATAIALATILLTLSGCSSSDLTPGSLSTPTNESESAVGVTKDNPGKTDESKPKEKIGINTVKAKFNECANKLVVGDLRDNTHPVVNSCFFSYGYHLQDMFGLRDVSELSVSKISERDDFDNFYDVILSVKEKDAVEIRTYFIPVTNQFKVVDSKPTKYGAEIMNRTIRQESMIAFRGA